MAPNKKINDNLNNYKLTINIILILICFVKKKLLIDVWVLA